MMKIPKIRRFEFPEVEFSKILFSPLYNVVVLVWAEFNSTQRKLIRTRTFVKQLNNIYFVATDETKKEKTTCFILTSG